MTIKRYLQKTRENLSRIGVNSSMNLKKMQMISNIMHLCKIILPLAFKKRTNQRAFKNNKDQRAFNKSKNQRAKYFQFKKSKNQKALSRTHKKNKKMMIFRLNKRHLYYNSILPSKQRDQA